MTSDLNFNNQGWDSFSCTNEEYFILHINMCCYSAQQSVVVDVLSPTLQVTTHSLVSAHFLLSAYLPTV